MAEFKERPQENIKNEETPGTDNAFNSSETVKGYYDTTPPLPKVYIDFLLEIHKKTSSNGVSQSKSSILDLGCGDGKLALSFVRESNKVTGIDGSKAMIDVAKEKDRENKANWVNKDAENFLSNSQEEYDFILSHDSFHLFNNRKELIEKCRNSLRPGGIFGIGSAIFNFDINPDASEALQRVLVNHNVLSKDNSEKELGDWHSSEFADLMSEAGLKVTTETVKNKTSYSIREIIDYLLNISLTANLDKEVKDKIYQELYYEFKKIFPEGICSGDDEYRFVYGQK